MSSKSFGARKAKKPHLLSGSGGLSAEVADVRLDVEEALQDLEAWKNLPQITQIASDKQNRQAAALETQQQGVSDTEATALTITGTGFDGQGRAALTHAPRLDANQSDLVFRAIKPGSPGNDISIELKAGAGGGEVVSVSGSSIQVTMRDNGATAAQIQTAVHGDAGAKVLVHCEELNRGTRATLFAALAETKLAGGLGESDFKVTVGGTDVTPDGSTYGTANKPSPTKIVCKAVGANTFALAIGWVAVHVNCGGMAAFPVVLPVVDSAA